MPVVFAFVCDSNCSSTAAGFLFCAMTDIVFRACRDFLNGLRLPLDLATTLAAKVKSTTLGCEDEVRVGCSAGSCALGRDGEVEGKGVCGGGGCEFFAVLELVLELFFWIAAGG